MQVGVVVFPGTWSDTDCYHAISGVMQEEARYLWHKDTNLSGVDCVIIPGGFAYGDYLRPGAIAKMSPIMQSVANFAQDGGLVLGICNGFQILCEAGLLPGALLRNAHLEFRCEWVQIRVENTATAFTQACTSGQVLHIPISHGDGNYYADPEILEDIEAKGQVIFRYCTANGDATPESNPNGSIRNIAGIISENGNVLGMMPHPERSVEELIGGTDGLFILRSLMTATGAL